MSEYLYWGVITLDDASEVLLDLEEHGWAEKTRLARTVRFALVPKDGIPLPPVVVNLPKGSKPVFKTRVKIASPRSPHVHSAVCAEKYDPEECPQPQRVPARIRIYGIGYKQGGHEPLFWILPNGAIEFGEDSPLADQLLQSLTYI